MAVAGGDVIQKKIVGLSRGSIINTSNPLAPVTYVTPSASQVTYDTGIELGKAEGVNCLGVKITRARFPVSEDPKVTLTFPTVPEMLAFKLNRQFQAQTSVSSNIFQSDFIVPSNGVVAARPAGTLGNGISADVVSKAWALNGAGITETTALTQGTFSTFDAAATPYGFAVGADFAMKFGQSLWGSTVSFDVPVTIASMLTLGSQSFSSLALRLAFVTIDRKSLLNLIFPSVSIDSTGSVNFTDGNIELGFFVNGSPQVELLPLANFC